MTTPHQINGARRRGYAGFAGICRRSSPTFPRPAGVALMASEGYATWLRREADVYYFAFKHPRVRWNARLVAVCAAAYLCSPVQLIPSFIPVIGFLDDFLVLVLGARLLRKMIPAEVFAECRQRAEAAEARRKYRIRSRVAIVASIVILALWVLAIIIANALLVRLLRRGI